MNSQSHQQTAEALSADLYAGAKLILLTEDGELPERLVRAYGGMAGHAAPLAAQLPGTLSDRVRDLHRALTGGAEGGLEFLPDVVARLTRDQQVRVAMDVADLADALALEVSNARTDGGPVD